MYIFNWYSFCILFYLLFNNTCVYNAKDKARVTRECKEIDKETMKRRKKKKTIEK